MTDPTAPRSFISRRLVSATRNSLSGLRVLWGEEAFRIEALLCLVLLPLALWLGDDAVDKVLMVGALAIVIIVETLNTAVEKTIDRISAEIHPLSGHAKDLGSCAVLFALVLAVFVWAMVLLD